MTKKTLPLLSASQLKKSGAYDIERGCWRRWYYNYVEGRREPSGSAAERGTAYHAEMEAWGRDGTFPTSPPAIKALKWAAPPGIADIERPILLETPGGWSWRGFIDVAMGWGGPADLLKGKPVLLGSGDLNVVQDWKFTGSLRNAKSPEYLQRDAASVLYGKAISGEYYRDPLTYRWVYIEMSSTRPLPVVFHIPSDALERRYEELNRMGDEIQAAYASNPRAVDMPQNTDQCYAFKQPCPFMQECAPKFRMSITGAIVTEFEKNMEATFPDDAPPPPLDDADDAPPPPPEDDDVPTPETERGFVNAPEADPTPAASPEALLERQASLPGMNTAKAAPVADAVTTAYLEGLSREDLKALAIEIGAVESKSKAREKTLREAIVAKGWRMESMQKAYASGTPLPEGTTLDDVGVPPPPDDEGEPAPEPLEVFETPPPPSAGFTLYVNCAPMAGGYTTSAELVRLANLRIAEAHGVPDWRFIAYTGAAELNQTVAALLEDGPLSDITDLVIDVRTPEGSVLVDTLTQFATNVVRGF